MTTRSRCRGFADDAELARAVANGEPGAIDAWFEHIYPLIERGVARYGGLSEWDREDMAGQVSEWLTAGAPKQCREFRCDVASLRTYYSTIIKRTCVRYYRILCRQRRTELLPDKGDTASEAHGGVDHGPDTLVDGRRTVDLIASWKETLDSIDRTIFDERVLGRRSSIEVGKVVGRSKAAVDTRVARLKQALKAYLRRNGVILGMLLALLLAMVAPSRLEATPRANAADGRERLVTRQSAPSHTLRATGGDRGAFPSRHGSTTQRRLL